MKRALVTFRFSLIAILVLSGCGATSEEGPTLETGESEQALISCSEWDPPCPSGYVCLDKMCRLSCNHTTGQVRCPGTYSKCCAGDYCASLCPEDDF